MNFLDTRLGRVQILLLAIGVLALGAALWSFRSDPPQKSHPQSVRPRLRPRATASPDATPAVAVEQSRVRADGAAWAPSSQGSTTVPRFSESWFDDSGYTLVSQYTGSITDPDSLEQVKASRIGR